MKKILILLILTNIFTSTFCQKKYSLGIDAVLYTTNTKNKEKRELFSNNVGGLQLTYRKNTIGYNFITISMGGTVSDKNLYNYQNASLGYEIGNVFNAKNLFLLTEIGIGRFTSKKLNTSTITFAPSIGTGYNIHLSKSFLLRPYNNLVINLPNKIVTVLSNWGIGLHFCFDKK